MANVQLPSIGHTNSDIDGASFSQLQTIVKSLMNTTAILTEELTYLLNNLDTRNVNELNAEVIVAGSIVTDKIAAGAITADKISVQELSAITANMGKLTSGEIYGAYIATRENAYPRAEMSNLENLFAAYLNANNYIKVEANYAGSPSLNFIQDGSIKGRLQTLNGSLGIDSIGWLDITATGSVNIIAGGYLYIPSFGRIQSSTGQNLGVELDSKARIDQSGYNLAFDPTSRNLKMFTVEGDLLAQVNIP